MPKSWFRIEILPEVALLTYALALSAHRLSTLHHSALVHLDLTPLHVLIVALPFVALIRPVRWSPYFMVPFTDERGYRSVGQVDDGFAVGLSIPIILASAFLCDILPASNELGFPDIRPITDIWQKVFDLPAPSLSFDARSIMIKARASLLQIVVINAYVFLLQIVLAQTFLRPHNVSKNNNQRLIAATVLALVTSTLLLVTIYILRFLSLGEWPDSCPAVSDSPQLQTLSYQWKSS